ncbi:MAG: hypothetical protein QG635_1817, partial [Bacteroidota bacterium]|nr:hypothetical protein [Bacteroidota bacterium]
MRIFYFLLIIIFPIILQSQVLWEKDSQGDIMMFKFSQSGAYLATASRYDNTVKITDIKSEKILQTIKNDSLAQLKFIQFGNGDSSLFAGFIIKGRVTVYQWDWQNKILFSSTITDSIGASLLKMSKDCNYLCGIDSILTPFLFDMRSKKMLDIEKFAEGDEVVDIDISDDSRIMALAMPEYINIVQLDSLSLQNSISAICHKFTKIYFSGGGGDFIAKFEPSEYTYIYDVAGGQQYQSVFWTDRPLGLYFLNKDTLISWGSSIRFYDLNTKDSSTTLYDASIGYFDIIKSEEKYIYAVKTLGVDIYELDNPIKLHALLIRYSNPFFIYDGKQLISNKIVMTSGTGAIVKNIMRNKNIIAYSDYYYCYTTDTTQKIYFDNYYSEYPTDSFKLPNKFSRAYSSRDLSAWIYNTSSTNYRYFDRNTGIDTAIADSAYYFEISRTGKYAAYYRGTRFAVNQFYLVELSSLKN